MRKLNEFLDKHVLPYPVKFLTHRFVILATIGLLAPLILFAHRTDFVLAVNSYLNTMSVAVSSIVLLYAMLAEVRDRQIAAMHERRAQEDHMHLVEMHQLSLESIRVQHEEIQELKRLLAEMLGVPFTRVSPPRGSVTDLRALHPGGRRRFDQDQVQRRMSRHVACVPGGRVAPRHVAPEAEEEIGA